MEVNVEGHPPRHQRLLVLATFGCQNIFFLALSLAVVHTKNAQKAAVKRSNIVPIASH